MSDANALQQRGIELFQERDYEAAADIFTEARAAYQAADQRDMAAEMDVNLGLVQRALGDNGKAIDLMQQALEVFSELDDQKRLAQVLGNLGGVLVSTGDTEQAVTCYRQAADAFKALGEEDLYGQTLLALGDLQVKSGNIMSGATMYEIALDSVDNLSGTQKVIKGLLGVKNRLMGGGAAPALEDGEEEAPAEE